MFFSKAAILSVILAATTTASAHSNIVPISNIANAGLVNIADYQGKTIRIVDPPLTPVDGFAVISRSNISSGEHSPNEQWQFVPTGVVGQFTIQNALGVFLSYSSAISRSSGLPDRSSTVVFSSSAFAAKFNVIAVSPPSVQIVEATSNLPLTSWPYAEGEVSFPVTFQASGVDGLNARQLWTIFTAVPVTS